MAKIANYITGKIIAEDESKTVRTLAEENKANLSLANLSKADLTGAVGCIPLPVGEPRQYRPVAVWVCGAWRIYSGCQACTIAEAREHWGADNYHTPSLGAQYVAAMDWLEQQPTPVTACEDGDSDE